MELSIIIPSWNTKELLKDCLDSIEKNSRGLTLEIIVIDNGSEDGSVNYLKNLKNIVTVFNKKNLGFAKANNQGLKKASGEYILLLNSDTIVKKETLKTMVDYLKKNSAVAGVSPMLLNPDDSKQTEYYMKFPNIWQILFYHNILTRPILMKTPLKNLMVSKASKIPFEVDQLPGAALMTRRSILNQVGNLDENYSFLFEDVDWCYRVKKAGLGRLMVLPQVKITHIGGGSWKQWLKEDRLGFYQHYFKSLLLFVKKHYPKKIFIFRQSMRLTFLFNGLLHFLFLRWRRGLVQFRLVLRI